MVIFDPETDDPYQVSALSVQMECPYCGVWMDLTTRGRIVVEDAANVPCSMLVGTALSDAQAHLSRHVLEEKR